MKERLFFDRIALDPADVSPGNVEFAAPIEADSAHSGLAFCNGAAMSAGEAADPVPLDALVEIAFADALDQNFAK